MEPLPRTESPGTPAFTAARRIASLVIAAVRAASFRVDPRAETSKVAMARSGGSDRVAVPVVRTCGIVGEGTGAGAGTCARTGPAASPAYTSPAYNRRRAKCILRHPR